MTVEVSNSDAVFWWYFQGLQGKISILRAVKIEDGDFSFVHNGVYSMYFSLLIRVDQYFRGRDVVFDEYQHASLVSTLPVHSEGLVASDGESVGRV